MPLYTGNTVIILSALTSTVQKGHFIFGIAIMNKLKPWMIIIEEYLLFSPKYRYWHEWSSNVDFDFIQQG